MYSRARPSGHWLDWPDTTYGVVVAAEFEQWDEAILQLKQKPPVPVIGILSRAFPPTSLNRQTDGIVTTGNYRARHFVRQSCHDLQLAYSNWYNNAGLEAPGLNDITIRAGLEMPSGVIIPVFFQGSRDVVIKPGATVWSDVISVEPRFTEYVFSRTFVTVSAGGKWPVSIITVGPEGADTASGVDKTTSGTISPTSTYGYFPYAIRATPNKADIPVIVGIGDSVLAGYTDGAPADTGYLQLALADQYAFQQLSFPSDISQAWARNKNVGSTADALLRRTLIQGATHAVTALGRNSLGLNLSQLQLVTVDLWVWLAARSILVWQTTITPQTTSTDGWVTTVNQTVANSTLEAKRVQFNDWIRDGAPILDGTAVATGSNAVGTLRAGDTDHPLAGYFEIADLAETSRNSGIWKASYTGDGTHPNTLGNTNLKTGVDPSVFGAQATT